MFRSTQIALILQSLSFAAYVYGKMNLSLILLALSLVFSVIAMIPRKFKYNIVAINQFAEEVLRTKRIKGATHQKIMDYAEGIWHVMDKKSLDENKKLTRIGRN